MMHRTRRIYARLSGYLSQDRYTISAGVVDWLAQHLQSDWSVLEFGSGASTTFFAERVRRVVSVETDATWYGYTQQNVAARSNVELLPSRRLLTKGEVFDLILVDGGIRKRNLAHTVHLFSRFLIVDDTHVPKWNALSQVVSQYFQKETTIRELPAFNRYLRRQTTIWNATPVQPLALEDFRDRICPAWRVLEMDG